MIGIDVMCTSVEWHALTLPLSISLYLLGRTENSRCDPYTLTKAGPNVGGKPAHDNTHTLE